MTDRKLLEKAAKAAGYEFEGHTRTGNGIYLVGEGQAWNPLTDDGDALRLAVKLKISVTQFSFFARAEVNGDDDFVEAQSDLYAATRRAIVRAAAAIGETL